VQLPPATRPPTGGEQTAFPQVRVVGVAECGTHALLDATMGPLAQGETTLAAGLLGADGALAEGMLLLANRLFAGAQPWRQAPETRPPRWSQFGRNPAALTRAAAP